VARAPATSCADDVILPSRDWLKTKCNEIGKFVITGFRDSTPGEIEAITVAEVIDDKLLLAGEVQFGVGRRLREALEAIRLEPRRGGRRVPVRPVLGAEIKFFGRHRDGMIREPLTRSVAGLRSSTLTLCRSRDR
jgi:ATP-dependent DNA ligase